ncbi:hypothetical protein [Nitrosomonas sp. Nm33]|uniref:hypothetical protein n=1 Tax=Nitrosomonas sp. Nm33 TaxID=133724 RepID=UPI00089D13D1|nr:hypothetical protein [Nitrosomonas sp. Nm33]SDY96232.1 hypothetical protein SAMN05421755_107215 [Nitrosomonas sp. Nm33]
MPIFRLNTYFGWQLIRIIALYFALMLSSELFAATNPLTQADPINSHAIQQDNTSLLSQPIYQDECGTDEQPLVVKSVEAEKTESRLEQDRKENMEALENEKKLGFWTLIIAVATSVTVLVGIGQLFMFRRQLLLMTSSIQLARDEFNASHRPWVKCDVALATSAEYPSAVQFDQNGMYLTLKFTMKNTGTVPALNVWPEWEIALSRHTRDFYIDIQRKICDVIKTRERGKYAYGFTIFSSETVEITIRRNIAQSEIDADVLNDFMNEEQSIKTITVNAIGCIDYRSAIDLKHHQTGFSYYVCATQMDGGKTLLHGPLLPIQSDPIPMSDLYLSPNHMDGHLFFTD